MSERIEKAKELLERYGNDTARMLDENSELEIGRASCRERVLRLV